jgi:hypothetical protein
LAALSAARDDRRGGFKVLMGLSVFAILASMYDLQYALAPGGRQARTNKTVRG